MNMPRQDKSFQDAQTVTVADITRRAEVARDVTSARDSFVPTAAASVWAATLYPVAEAYMYEIF